MFLCLYLSLYMFRPPSASLSASASDAGDIDEDEMGITFLVMNGGSLQHTAESSFYVSETNPCDVVNLLEESYIYRRRLVV